MVTAPTSSRAFPHSRNSLNLFRLILAAAVLYAHAFYITGNGTGPTLHGENIGGWAVAGFFGKLEETLEEDLRRFKSYAEARQPAGTARG